MELEIKVSSPYKVVFSKGCLAGGSISELLAEYKGKRLAVITDDNVKALYLDSLVEGLSDLGEVFPYSFPSGEDSKSLQTVERIYDFLTSSGITRTDLIIALGGGIVGDTAGFAAATYLRGVKLVQIPTTLLAMVDSSIGGKTAINLSAGKNLAGSFSQPAKVIVDIEFLDTLNADEWQNGIGEIIKYGAIMDRGLFALMESGRYKDKLEEVIFRCLKIKKKVVEKDTLDTGIRQILNFGHTLAHAVERHSGFSVSHGKAVGIGMALISRWAEQRCLVRQGVAERIERVLERYGLPYGYELSAEGLWGQAAGDKKRKGDKITLALVEEIGKCALHDIAVDSFCNAQIDLTFLPSFLKGVITAPPSKSMAHRAVFCAILSQHKSVIRNISLSEDITASINAARALGCQAVHKDNVLTMLPGKIDGATEIDCGESGTTFRFLLPVLAALGKKATIIGRGRLGERPYAELTDELAAHGAQFDRKDGLPLSISGRIRAGDYSIRGDVSSQYISGLLLALPLLEGDSRLMLTSELSSAPYVDMTISCMQAFGVEIKKIDGGFLIRGGQKYKGAEYEVEGDYSNAAFFLCAGALNGDIEVEGLSKSSLQGDSEIIDILRKAGADITETAKGYCARKSALRGVDIDASEIPDLVPVAALTLAGAEGGSVFRNTERLKIKECDRQLAVKETIAALGGKVEVSQGDIVICKGLSSGGVISGRNDHRMVMSLAAAAINNNQTITVLGAQTTKKSYPDFFLDYKSLGGKYVVYMGK